MKLIIERYDSRAVPTVLIAVPVTDDVALITIERMVAGALGTAEKPDGIGLCLRLTVPSDGREGEEFSQLVVHLVELLEPVKVAKFVRRYIEAQRHALERAPRTLGANGAS